MDKTVTKLHEIELEELGAWTDKLIVEGTLYNAILLIHGTVLRDIRDELKFKCIDKPSAKLSKLNNNIKFMKKYTKDYIYTEGRCTQFAFKTIQAIKEMDRLLETILEACEPRQTKKPYTAEEPYTMDKVFELDDDEKIVTALLLERETKNNHTKQEALSEIKLPKVSTKMRALISFRALVATLKLLFLIYVFLLALHFLIYNCMLLLKHLVPRLF